MYNTVISKIDLNLIVAYFFLQDSADIEKTFLYYFLIYHYYALKKIVLCVTSFKIVILLLFKNMTAHFKFKISLKCKLKSICRLII